MSKCGQAPDFRTWVKNYSGKKIYEECARRVEIGAEWTTELLNEVFNDLKQEAHMDSVRAGCTLFNSD